MSTMDADATFNKTAARNGSFANIAAESVAHTIYERFMGLSALQVALSGAKQTIPPLETIYSRLDSFYATRTNPFLHVGA